MKKILNYKAEICFLIFAILFFSIIAVQSERKMDEVSPATGASEPWLMVSGGCVRQKIAEGMLIHPVKAINIIFGTFDQENQGNLSVTLYKGQQSVQSWSMPLSMLEDNAFQSFVLDEPIMDLKEEYSFEVETTFSEECLFAIWVNKESEGAFSFNGEQAMGCMEYSLTYQNVSLRRIFLLGAFLVLLCLFLAAFYGEEEELIMSAIMILMVGSYLWLCPPGMAPDETNHFFRAFEVAKVSLISEHIGEDGEGGNRLPIALVSYQDKKAALDWQDTAEIRFGNTALYSPVSYLPQALGIKVANLFTDKVHALFCGGKISNAIICLLLCLYALRVAPFGRRILFLTMTFPMSLQEMVSLAPDGFVIALSLLLFAYVLKLAYSDEPLKKKDVMILCVLGMLVSLCKIIYVVLLLLIFLIPKERFSSRKKEWGIKLGLLFTAVLINLIWLKISAGFLVEFNPGVDSPGQVKFVLTHLFSYYKIAIRTMLSNDILCGLGFWIPTMFGSNLGAMNIVTAKVIWIAALMAFLYETINCEEMPAKVKAWDSLILIFTFLVGAGLVFTSLYVQWTPLEQEIIDGIQGRYFIPLLAMLSYAIILIRGTKRKAKWVRREAGAVVTKAYPYLLAVVCTYNALALLDLIAFYIHDLW